MAFDRLDADGGGQVGLSRPKAADKDGVMGVLQELAAVELAHQRFVDLA